MLRSRRALLSTCAGSVSIATSVRTGQIVVDTPSNVMLSGMTSVHLNANSGLVLTSLGGKIRFASGATSHSTAEPGSGQFNLAGTVDVRGNSGVTIVALESEVNIDAGESFHMVSLDGSASFAGSAVAIGARGLSDVALTSADRLLMRSASRFTVGGLGGRGFGVHMQSTKNARLSAASLGGADVAAANVVFASATNNVDVQSSSDLDLAALSADLLGSEAVRVASTGTVASVRHRSLVCSAGGFSSFAGNRGVLIQSSGTVRTAADVGTTLLYAQRSVHVHSSSASVVAPSGKSLHLVASSQTTIETRSVLGITSVQGSVLAES